MSPNPYILLRNLINPRRWFARNASSTEDVNGRVEHWDEPVPGSYKYVPGRGWFLIEVDADDAGKLDEPMPLTYCRILHRFMLKDEFEGRKKWGKVRDEDGNMAKGVLFRLDDGITWIYCWNEVGEFDARERKIPYCIDSETGKFRVMSTADREEASRSSSINAGRQATAPQGRPALSPSMRSFVGGDVHSAPRSRASLPSTQPSTRPSSRQGSSSNSGLHTLSRSTATTPHNQAKSQTSRLDAPELDRRLRKLKGA